MHNINKYMLLFLSLLIVFVLTGCSSKTKGNDTDSRKNNINMEKDVKNSIKPTIPKKYRGNYLTTYYYRHSYYHNVLAVSSNAILIQAGTKSNKSATTKERVNTTNVELSDLNHPEFFDVKSITKNNDKVLFNGNFPKRFNGPMFKVLKKSHHIGWFINKQNQLIISSHLNKKLSVIINGQKISQSKSKRILEKDSHFASKELDKIENSVNNNSKKNEKKEIKWHSISNKIGSIVSPIM